MADSKAGRKSLTALFLALFGLLLTGLAPARAEPVRTGHAVAELIAERSVVAPGDTFLAALYLDLDEGGWHVYWKNPGDSGLPPAVSWTLPEGSEAGEFIWPAPHAIPLTTLMNYGYEHELVLPVEITVPATLKPGDTFEVTGDATWLICLDICLPEEAILKLSLPVGEAPIENAGASAKIAGALTSRPQPLGGAATVQRTATTFRIAVADAEIAVAATTAGEIRFFPNGSDILHAAPQKVRRGEAGVLVEVPFSDYAPEGEADLGGIIVVNDRDGSHRAWEIVATPGPVPAGVDATAVSGSSGGGAALSLAGLVALLGAAFLGGLILNLMPCVLPVLSIKAAALVHTAHKPAEARAHGLAYLAGVLVCFVGVAAILLALRAAGEAAGFGFQMQYPPMVAAFALLLFLIGLNLLGVFEFGASLMGVGGNLADRKGSSGAFFTGMLAAFVGAPCIGPFMGPAVGAVVTQPPHIVVAVFLVIGLGLAAPLVLLSFTPAMAKLLPKPGKWMETFRQVLAFPMFFTALWLLWILAGQTGSDGVIMVLAGATVLAFGVWLARKAGSGAAGRTIAALVILAAFLAPTWGASTLQFPAEDGTDYASAELATEAWSPERVSQLRAEGRVFFVDFTARWCATCQVNKRVAIYSAEAKKAFEETGGILLIADWTNRDSVIAEALAEFGRAGVPLYLVYPASGGDPEVLPQMLSPGLVAKSLREAAGEKTADRTQPGNSRNGEPT